MKKLYSGLIFGFIFSFGYLTVFSCTCVNSPLAKRFKKAEAVFIGKIADVKNEDPANIQNYREGLPVLSVAKSWKGVKKENVAVDFADFPKSTGTCPILYSFEKDKEYLVFAYGKDLKVEVECSDTRALEAKYDYTTKEISRLDSFWFRFRAKLNPF